MTHKGFSHIGLSTRDLDSTRDFYENVLGFKVARCDIIKIAEGGQIRHIFFDTQNPIQCSGNSKSEVCTLPNPSCL